METMAKKWYAKALSLLLACLMVVTMVPPIHVHAAEKSITTDKEEYSVGEPIMVTLNSDDHSDWAAVYPASKVDDGGDKYWYWLYVDGKDGDFSWSVGQPYELYTQTKIYGYEGGGTQGSLLPPGEYAFRYENSGNTGIRKQFTISPIEPSVEFEKETVTEADSIKVKARTNNSGSWVALFPGELSIDEIEDDGTYGNNWYYNFFENRFDQWYAFPAQGAGKYTAAAFDGGAVVACDVITVKESDQGPPPDIATDKQVYNFGEPIMVTSQYGNPNWVGLYKQDDANPTSEGPTSMFWLYATPGEPVNILSGEQQRSSEYVGGTYKVLLLSANYDIIASVENIEINAVPSEPVRTEPTCEKDGKIVISYNDGTSETVTADEDASLKKLGHNYSNWVYNGKDEDTGEYTHTKICANPEVTCEAHTVTEACAWDDGVETKPASPTENGEMTYTCGVCEGTRKEAIPAKQPVGEPEVIEPATCQKVGVLRTYYSEDKTEFIDSDIPMLQHEFSTWKPVEGTKQHSHICLKNGKPEGHTEVKDCEYDGGVRNGDQWTYTCDVCEGTHSEPILDTDKDVYNFNEPITVTLNYPNYGEKDWVALYKKSDTIGAAGCESWFWNYLPALKTELSGFNMIDSKNDARPGNDSMSQARKDQYTAGEYMICLLENDSYNVIVSKDITIKAVAVDEVRTEPTCEKDGKIVISYNDGTSETVNADKDESLKKLGHDYSNWVFDEESKTHTKTCGNPQSACETPTVTEDCTFDGGVITKPSSANELGEKTYTCSVCEGTYKLPYSDKPIKSEVITKDPTCDEEGIKLITFEDNTTMELPIDKLGHDYSDWAYDGDVLKTHTKVCANDATHFITENCAFVFNGTTANGVSYKCDVCGGIFEDGILSSDKDTYELGEPILVTALCDMQGSWVGLYKKGDKYNPDLAGGVVSLYWYYVTKDDEGCARSGQQINLLDFRNIDRVDGLANGSYELVLFGDTGYTNVLAKKDIEIYTDMSNTTFDVKVNGQLQSNNAEIAYPIGSQIEMTVSAEGNPGTSWVGVYASKLGANANFVDASSYWAYINEINGQTIVLNDKMEIGPGDYTIVVFENGGYDKPIQFIYFSLNPDTTYSEIIKAPTCTDYGTKLVKYEGSDAPTYVPIAPLGHDVEWTYSYDAINDKHTHSGVCKRAECGELVVKDCAFDEGELIEGTVENGTVKYTCTVCGGSYTEINMAPPPVDTNVYNIAGEDRYATALDTADMLKEKMNVDFFNAIVLASGDNFPDALAGSYLANAKQAPILLINQSTLESVKAYITANLSADGTVYILGGEKAISAAVEDALSAYNVKRLSGDDRYETNLAILNEAGVEGEDILVCTGENYADSLSASAVGKPVLLVKDTLTAGQKAILNKSSGRIYILGGINAVSKEIEAELRAFGATMRIGGEDRQATSVMIAEVFFNAPETVMVAYSNNYPDGLCAGPLAYCMNAPLILTRSDNAQAAKDYIAGNDIEGGMVLGGEKVFDNQAIRDIFGMDETDSIVGRN